MADGRRLHLPDIGSKPSTSEQLNQEDSAVSVDCHKDNIVKLNDQGRPTVLSTVPG